MEKTQMAQDFHLHEWFSKISTQATLRQTSPRQGDERLAENCSQSLGFSIKEACAGVPLWLSWLRIQCCHCYSSGHSCGADLNPSLRTSTCCGCSQTNKQTNKQKRAHTLCDLHYNLPSTPHLLLYQDTMSLVFQEDGLPCGFSNHTLPHPPGIRTPISAWLTQT